MHPTPILPFCVVVLLLPSPERCNDGISLADAFRASFGSDAPALRTARQTIDTRSAPHGDGADTVFELRPERLVALGGRHYALVTLERNRNRAWATGGWIAVSYLRRAAAGWQLLRRWPELLFSGSYGDPLAEGGSELHRFGAGDPLFFARSSFCAPGSCSEGIGVVRLSRTGPMAFEAVTGGGKWPSDPSDQHGFDSCRNAEVTATIGPPLRTGALFSIRYDGWTAAPGTLSPRTPMHLRTSYTPWHGRLLMRPTVPVPECGR